MCNSISLCFSMTVQFGGHLSDLCSVTTGKNLLLN